MHVFAPLWREHPLNTDKKLSKNVLKVVRSSKIPVNVSYVSQQTGISWGTAKEILLELAARKDIGHNETTGGFIFFRLDDS